MTRSSAPRRALPATAAPGAAGTPRRAAAGPHAGDRQSPARHARPEQRPRHLAAALGCGGALLSVTAAFAIVATPPAHAHDPAPTSSVAQRDPSAVSRGALDRSTAAARPAEETPVRSEVAAFHASQAAAARQAKQTAREQAIAGLVKRWGEQEAARQKNYGNTPKDKLPADGAAAAIYPDGVPRTPSFRLPVDAGQYTLSSDFGAVGLWWPYHNGQDFAAPVGTPAYAVTDAIVGPDITEGWAGIHVVLHFADGSAAIYAHLNDALVQPGQVVHAGDLIGHVGNTGRSFGAHLHFQYYAPGCYAGDYMSATDPVPWLEAHGLKP